MYRSQAYDLQKTQISVWANEAFTPMAIALYLFFDLLDHINRILKNYEKPI